MVAVAHLLRSRRSLFVAALALGFAAWGAQATPATAANWSGIGADTAPVGHPLLRVGVGWPDLDVTYHYAVSKDFDVAPRFRLGWGVPYFHHGTLNGIDNGLGIEARYRLVHNGRFSATLRGQFGILLFYTMFDKFTFGLYFGPNLVLQYALKPNVHLIGGLDVPVHLAFAEGGTGALVPILFPLGIEFFPSKQVSLYGLLELGPSLGIDKEGTVTGFGLIGKLGLTYRF